MDLRPDVVVDIGDWATMGSLYLGDWGKMRGEGKRVADDIAFARDARERVHVELQAYNKGRKVKYQPKLYSTVGNHEDRIVKAVERSPHLYGTISVEDLGYKDFGWKAVPFCVPLEIDGLWYAHHWTNGGGKPVSSEKHHAAQLLDKGLVSCVQGHSHRYDLSIRQRWDGSKAMAIVAGCYFEHVEPWAGADNSRWDRGLTLIRDVQAGFGHVEFISMKRIKDTYGG